MHPGALVVARSITDVPTFWWLLGLIGVLAVCFALKHALPHHSHRHNDQLSERLTWTHRPPRGGGSLR